MHRHTKPNSQVLKAGEPWSKASYTVDLKQESHLTPINSPLQGVLTHDSDDCYQSASIKAPAIGDQIGLRCGNFQKSEAHIWTPNSRALSYHMDTHQMEHAICRSSHVVPNSRALPGRIEQIRSCWVPTTNRMTYRPRQRSHPAIAFKACHGGAQRQNLGALSGHYAGLLRRKLIKVTIGGTCSKLTQLGTQIALIPLFCLRAQFAADLLTAAAGNSQLINAKEIVQLLYNQGIERVHDACECQGPGGRGLWKESRGGVWCAGGNVALSQPFVVSKMDLVNT